MSPRGEQSLGCHGAGWWRFKPAAALEALELDGLLVGAGLGVLLHVDDIVGEGDAEARLLQHGVDGVDGVDGLDGVRGGPHETEGPGGGEGAVVAGGSGVGGEVVMRHGGAMGSSPAARRAARG